ncbi:MAG: MliC family protein [Burkholderiaceae bacterium]|nr:MliC family protein [Burkholderiaceae bacterium]MEB2319663.1 MliC family protein [Pseudomonadota bacterium]
MKPSFKFLAVSIGLACAAGTVQANGLTMTKGLYKCELNRQVNVTDVSADRSTATIQWGKKGYVLRAVPARTGALRYEDVDSGLTWLVIVGKSMLLDTKNGKQLANECKV